MLEINFMQGLLKNNVIDKNIFALFLDHYRAKDVERGTHIKFGGYDLDSNTIKEGSSLKFAKSISDQSWNMAIS